MTLNNTITPDGEHVPAVRVPPAQRMSRLLPGRIDQWAPIVMLVVLTAAFSMLNDQFMTADNWRTIANQAAIPMVLAVGLTFVILTGSIDLSAEGVMASTSISVSLMLANSLNSNDLGLVAVAGGIAIGAAFGLVNGLLYARLRLPSLIVTLGTWFIGLGIASYLFPDQQPVVRDQSFRSWALGEWLGVSRLVTIAVLVAVAGAVLLRYTRIGRHVYGIGGAEDLMRLAGIRVDTYKTLAFVIAGALAGLAGLMATAQLGVGNANAGADRLFPALSAVVLGGTHLAGGRGGVLQSVLGVLVLVVLGNGMILSGVGPYVQQAVVGAVIIVAVVATGWGARDRLRVVK
ncbi:ABC transporter permease [Nonomuraea sp. B5E05]|uniref:ABC transporter permease n=1 Tax=Nonomuraea sp. B5E05 TaxID=3153569 RepID=UPI0032607832